MGGVARAGSHVMKIVPNLSQVGGKHTKLHRNSVLTSLASGKEVLMKSHKIQVEIL